MQKNIVRLSLIIRLNYCIFVKISNKNGNRGIN